MNAPIRHGAAAIMGMHARRAAQAAHPPLTAREAVDHGCSMEATARAIARSWARQYGHRGAAELIDAMQDEARSAANG